MFFFTLEPLKFMRCFFFYIEEPDYIENSIAKIYQIFHTCKNKSFQNSKAKNLRNWNSTNDFDNNNLLHKYNILQIYATTHTIEENWKEPQYPIYHISS